MKIENWWLDYVYFENYQCSLRRNDGIHIKCEKRKSILYIIVIRLIFGWVFAMRFILFALDTYLGVTVQSIPVRLAIANFRTRAIRIRYTPWSCSSGLVQGREGLNVFWIYIRTFLSSFSHFDDYWSNYLHIWHDEEFIYPPPHK